MNAVVAFVNRLATGKPVDYKIGSKFTGKREYHWDSRSGVYSESLPLIGYDEWLIQMCFCPDKLVRRRKPNEVRQR